MDKSVSLLLLILKSMNFTEQILSHYKKRPEAPCLSYKKDNQWLSYTWQTFTEKVAQTTHALQESGLSAGDCVAIFAHNIPEWLMLDVAALSIGVIVVPVYATSTVDQVKYILDETEARLVLAGDREQYDKIVSIYAQSDTLETILTADSGIKTAIDNAVFFHDWIKDKSVTSHIISRREDDLATIIYTSGTTGEAKGVMLTQSNFTKSFQAHKEFFKFDHIEEEHSLSFLPYSHVFERSWALMMLYLGARVYVLENPKLIAQTLTEVRPTMMCSVPRLYQKIYAGIKTKVEESGAVKRFIFQWAYGVGEKLWGWRKI